MAVAACLALAACGPAEPEPGLVRLLDAAERDEPAPLVELAPPYVALDGWWLHHRSLEEVEPLEDRRTELVREAELIVPRGTAVFAPLVLPREVPWNVHATLAASDAHPGGPCEAVQLVRVPLSHEQKEQLEAGALPDGWQANAWHVLSSLAKGPSGTFDAPAGADGFAPVTVLMPRDRKIPQHAELRLATIWGRDADVRVRRASVRAAPNLRQREGYDTVLPEPGAVGRSALQGDERRAARVTPGAPLTLTVSVPAGARTLRMGLAPAVDEGDAADDRPRDDAGTGSPPSATGPDRATTPTAEVPTARASRASVRWRVTLPELELELGTGRLEHDPDAFARFEDVDLTWPSDVRGDVVVSFIAEGEADVLLAEPVLLGSPAHRPNLLFVSIDTLRADHVGYHGYPRPTTPALDRWAERSTVFLDVVAVAPYTLPTHATLFTGLLPRRHGAVDTTDRLDTARAPPLARRLADAGWVTAGFTGGGFLSPDFGFDEGFDRYATVDPMLAVDAPANAARFEDEAGARLRALHEYHDLDEVEAWITRQGEHPWFAFVHTFSVHAYEARTEDFERFDTAPETDWTYEVRPEIRPKEWLEDPPSEGDVEHLVNLYDAALAGLDRELGAFLDRLDAAGRLDDTIVVVTSDHGEEFLDHGMLLHSRTVYQEMVHVPLLIHVPGRGGRRVDEPVSQADLLPTLLELLGLEPAEDLDGVSLVPLIEGRRLARRSPLFSEVDTALSGRRALRLGSWKVVGGDVGEERAVPAPAPWELFDLAEDPRETADLSTLQPDEFERLREALLGLEAWLAARSAPGADVELSESVRARLEELGYF